VGSHSAAPARSKDVSLGRDEKQEVDVIEPHETASLMLAFNHELVAEALKTNGADVVVAVLRATADIIERGAFKPEVMH